jgi:ribose transport system substrate-binding protein
MRRNGSKTLCLAVLVTVAALVTTACGSDKASRATAVEKSGDKVQEASAVLDALLAPLSFKSPGDPIKVGNKLNGKTIYFISAALEYEFTQLVLSGMNAAAAKAGVKIVALDAKGDTATASRQIAQAISQKASGIAIMNFPAKVLAEPLKDAKAAGIPVFDVFDGDEGLPTAEEAEIGVVAKVSFCFSCAGKQLAAMAVVQGKGKVNAALVTVPDVTAAVIEASAFKAELARLCSDCKVKEYGAPTARWATQLPSIGTAAVQDPNVNFVVPMFTVLNDFMKPSLLAAGSQGRVSVISYSAPKSAIQDFRKNVLITGLLGTPELWMGWGVMDQVFRVLTGGQPVAAEKVPNRAFTAANAQDADPVNGAKYTDTDFASEYLKLWGLAG